jgi:hypothetical protein
MTDPTPDQVDARQLKVIVFDEDNGETYSIEGEPETTVGFVVDELYGILRRSRETGDRLWCAANGDSVFAHLTERLEGYRSSHCSALEWRFVGDTGGART